MLKFSDHLSNALHEIKRHSGKKISVLMDELGYGFEPELSGDTIESWRYRKAPPTLAHLETLARLLVGYQAAAHDRDWLDTFLQSAKHPYSKAICDELFPAATKTEPESKSDPHLHLPLPAVNLLPPPPLKAYAPPAVSGFVGRQGDLSRYTTCLSEQTYAAISGMAGVGKTTLMSRLAAELEDQHAVFWHSFASGNIEPMVHRLTGFIANLGRKELWEMSEAARASGGRPPAVETLFDMLGVILGELPESLLLCLDDLQFVDEDVRLQPFLLKMFGHPNVNVLVTTRRYPSFFPAGKEEQLVGLNQAEAAELLQTRQVELSTDVIERLTKLTGGNGAFLTLAAVILKNSREPEEIIGRLAQEDDIERFLMEEVNDRLSNSEQRVMEAVAILCGYPANRDVIETMLNIRNVNRTLRALADQYLLLSDEGDIGERVYRQHQIIQAFFYDQPRRSRRRELHMKAADFYEYEEPGPLRAMLHHAKAGQIGSLVSLADSHFYDVVNQGEGKSLLTILAEVELEKSNLLDSQIIRFLLTRGRLQHMLGTLKTAEVDLQQAAEMLNQMAQTAETDQLKGEVCLAMGELLERQDLPEALRWVQRGLDIVPKAKIELLAQLQTLAGTINMHMGNFGNALESLMDGLENTPETKPRMRMNVLKNLGAVHFNLGQLAQAKELTTQALSQSISLKSHYQTARILINSGPIKYLDGDWSGAVEDLTEGLNMSEKLGNVDSAVSLSVNLGGCFTEMGKYDLAQHYLEHGIALCGGKEPHQLSAAYIRLAELSIKECKWAAAEQNLIKAEEIAKKMNDQVSLATVYGLRALQLAGLDKIEDASKWAEKAVDHDRRLGDEWTAGLNLRIQGKIASLNNDQPLMHKAYSQSIELLGPIDRFQAAVSQFEFGLLLHELGENERAKQLVVQTQSVFEKYVDSPEFRRVTEWIKGQLE